MSTPQVISTPRTELVSGDRILRYTLADRVNHWLSAVAYAYCLVTGLGFWSPYMFWLTALVGGGPTARFWHPWFGLIFAVSMFWMLKSWLPDMRVTDADRAWWRNVDSYITNQDEKLPPIGKFNYGQKLLFWVMFYGMIGLLVSGVLLWFPYSLSPWLRHLGVTVHVVAALATIGAIIIHVYMGTAMVRGSFTAMVRGYVPAAWARFHHRLWYEQVTRQEPPRQRSA